MFNPPIIDALEFYCKLIQTPLEKKDGVITLEPTNIYYGKQALYLPLCNLKSYFYSEISTYNKKFATPTLWIWNCLS